MIGRTDEGKKQFDLSGQLAPGDVLGCFKATIERGNHADLDGYLLLLQFLQPFLELC